VDADLLTVADAARLLDRSTEQVRRYLREGVLDGRRIGGQWFIARDTLTTFGQGLREERGFIERIPSPRKNDPLAAIIGIGRSGGADIAAGIAPYRRAAGWRS